MAKATRGRKPSTKRKAGQSRKFAIQQPPLDGMADVDERIPKLDNACQKFFAARDKRDSAKEHEAEASAEISELIKENNLDLYIFNGRKFYIEPGCESLKCVKVKQKE